MFKDNGAFLYTDWTAFFDYADREARTGSALMLAMVKDDPNMMTNFLMKVIFI